MINIKWIHYEARVVRRIIWDDTGEVMLARERQYAAGMIDNRYKLPAIRRDVEFQYDRTILWTKWGNDVWTFRYLACK